MEGTHESASGNPVAFQKLQSPKIKSAVFCDCKSCFATKLCRKPKCPSNCPINVSSRGSLILQRQLQGLWFLHILGLSPGVQTPMLWDLIRCHDQINSRSDLASSLQGLRGSWIVLFFFTARCMIVLPACKRPWERDQHVQETREHLFMLTKPGCKP